MRGWRAIGIALCLGGTAQAQTVEAPTVIAGDSWVYKDTFERGTEWQQSRAEATVVRAGSASILLSQRPAGSTLPPKEQMVGADWSRMRSVNGQETVVNRPLAFPLRTGRTWTVDFTENNPNRQHSSEHWKFQYRVIGWEKVAVGATTFDAVKIEAEGQWQATLAPAVAAVSGSRVDGQGTTSTIQTNRVVPQTLSGRAYKAFWYVPAVKRWVKAVEELYDPNGTRIERSTEEIETYKVAG